MFCCLFPLLTQRERRNGLCLDTLSHRCRSCAMAQSAGLGRILDAVWAKERAAFSLQKRFTAQLATALLSMARQGQGVTWIPQTLAAEDIEAGRLVDAGLGHFSVEVEIRLFRPVHGQTRAAEAFWKAMADASPA